MRDQGGWIDGAYGESAPGGRAVGDPLRAVGAAEAPRAPSAGGTGGADGEGMRPFPCRTGILSHAEGVDLMPANIELSGTEVALVNAMSREHAMRSWLDRAKRGYDFAIIDCPPSLGMMPINALTAADGVVVPVQAQYLPAKGMTQLVKTVNRVRRHINPSLRIEGVLLTLVDARTNLARQVERSIRGSYGEALRVYEAVVAMVDANMQRELVLPSEKAA